MRISTKPAGRLLTAIFCIASTGFFAVPAAHATDKNMIQLQVQVQALQDALERMQQTQDERWALTKQAMDQNTQTLSQVSAALGQMQQQIQAQNDSAARDQLSSQIQATHDAVDEVKARLARLERQMNDMAAQRQEIPATAPAGGGAPPDNGGQQQAPPPQSSNAPPVKSLYQAAYRDYTGAHYDLASSEFAQVIQAYPQDELAGNSQFYIGEIDYRQGQYKDAAKAYDAVLQNYPGSPKSSAAQLRKGDSLIQVGQRNDGIKELRSLIQRYPQSPEAVQARSTLNGMGVTPTPRTSAARNQ